MEDTGKMHPHVLAVIKQWSTQVVLQKPADLLTFSLKYECVLNEKTHFLRFFEEMNGVAESQRV